MMFRYSMDKKLDSILGNYFTSHEIKETCKSEILEVMNEICFPKTKKPEEMGRDFIKNFVDDLK